MPDNYRDPNYVTRRGGGAGGRGEDIEKLREALKWPMSPTARFLLALAIRSEEEGELSGKELKQALCDWREERELDETEKWERFWVGVGELWNALTEEEKDILLDGGDLPDDINERY